MVLQIARIVALFVNKQSKSDGGWMVGSAVRMPCPPSLILSVLSIQRAVGEELGGVLLAQLGAVAGVLQVLLLLVLAHLAHELRGVARPVLRLRIRRHTYLAAGNVLSLLHHRAGSEAGVRLQMRSLQDAAASSNAAVIVNTASAQHRSITDNHVVSNGHRTGQSSARSADTGYNRSVLDVALRSDPHNVAVALHD